MPTGSILRRERCHAITRRRGANTRCKHTTLRGTLCWQHEQALKGFRIKTSDLKRAGMGLFTTRPIEKGAIICEYSGDLIVDQDPEYTNPYALQIKERPPTFIDASRTNTAEGRWINDGREQAPNNALLAYDPHTQRGYVEATTDIPANTEILADYGNQYPWVKQIHRSGPIVPKWTKRVRHVPLIPRKRRLIRPDHGPEPEDWGPVIEEVEPPQPKPKPKIKRVARTPQEKHDIFFLKRLVVLEKLWADEKLAHKLKIPVSKHTIHMPKQKKNQLFNVGLEKLLKKETSDWVKYVNQHNPRHNMTYARAVDIIEKSV